MLIKIPAIPYTQLNVFAICIWLLLNRPKKMQSILWCNTLGIIAGYESIRFLQRDSFDHFLQHGVTKYREDIIAHWLPLYILWPKYRIKLHHVCVSVLANLIWGALYRYDLEIPYPSFKPPLNKRTTKIAWSLVLAGHLSPLVAQYLLVKKRLQSK